MSARGRPLLRPALPNVKKMIKCDFLDSIGNLVVVEKVFYRLFLLINIGILLICVDVYFVNFKKIHQSTFFTDV